MRGRTLFIYVCILVGLAGYYFYFEMYLPGLEHDVQEKDQTVFTIDPSGITRIDILKDTAITLAKNDSAWRITSPVDKPADALEVDGLVHAIVSMRPERSLGDTGPADELGLNPPRMSLTFRTKDADFFLHIGKPTPTKNYHYARSSTRDDIFLINTRERSRVDRDVFMLRDKHLFSAAYAEVSSITIRRHALILEFVRDSSGEWNLSNDNTMRIKTSKINDLLGRLCRVEARGYVSGQDLTTDPDIIVELAANDVSQDLKIWQMPYDGENIRAFSSAQGSHVMIRDALLSVIPTDLAEVMDRSVLTIDAEKVRKIIISDGDRRLFTRPAGTWQKGGKQLEDPGVIDAVLQALSGLEYAHQYMKLPDDADKIRSVQIFYGDETPVFDIILYSQYYVALGDQFYQIDEGGMRIVYDALDMLVKNSDG